MALTEIRPVAFRKEQEIFCVCCGREINQMLAGANEAEGIPVGTGLLSPIFAGDETLVRDRCSSCGFPIQALATT